MEWQFQGDDQWVFGKKIRGVVRYPIAEIYFDEEQTGRNGGWIWFTKDARDIQWSAWFWTKSRRCFRAS